MQAFDSTPPFVFISHSAADSLYADRMEIQLAELGIASWNFNSQVKAGDVYLDKARSALESCTHIFVLIGPLTKASKWVDMEMEVAMTPSEAGPGASLIGVILPGHGDFNRPYYDPELVPLRLHDFVRQDAALIRKWSENPADTRAWIAEAASRRSTSRRSRPSLATLRYIRENDWTNEGDVERQGLSSLSAQHLRPE